MLKYDCNFHGWGRGDVLPKLHMDTTRQCFILHVEDQILTDLVFVVILGLRLLLSTATTWIGYE